MFKWLLATVGAVGVFASTPPLITSRLVLASGRDPPPKASKDLLHLEFDP